ncbi:cyanophycinase [Microbulbifer hydrolyticus]|uniref:Cyanophycinase n=1 Tax=Microbulbifer hydrolyticus TaxID=48074 RepID=A0A6P1TCS2_9GAMM|nr:cyanophycinase [Microbulbifer hydrolyticus]MBB5210041.1 cyanophycinase [Microbulbifer hydrolyticus]QHQ39436.1 cyanophycinase [Microbulbifer hydrolyticus]
MKFTGLVATLAGLCLPLFAACSDSGAQAKASADSGSLLIVGGALRSDNTAVYRAFIEGVPEKFPDVVIVPAASGRPSHYAQQFQADLRSHGFKGRVRILPIADKDDKSTESIDESDWQQGGHDKALAESLNTAGGIWFVGGDQTRITRTLLDKEGRDTPVLAAIRAQLANGAIVGGTSAGAAIMSSTMIAAGDSLSALTLPAVETYQGMESQESGQLLLSRGLGFLPVGVVDQHFDRKARLGRLVRALGGVTRPEEPLGFGVDEDTALLVDLDVASMKVLGAGTLVVADARSATFADAEDGFAARDLRVSVLSHGDSYNWREHRVSASGSETLGNEAFGYRATQGAGIALANPRLDQLLGFSLLDNSDTRELRRYAFDDQTGKGVLFHFRQDDQSRGFWSYGSGTKDQYTILDVALDIAPVSVSVTAAR